MRRAERAVKAVKGDILGKRVLEVACGCAEFSLCAAGLAERVDCIDLDRGRLDERIGDCPNATFRKMDATALEYGDGEFDTVVLYNAVAHLEAVLEKALEEGRRVAGQDGCLYVISSVKMDKAVIEEKLLPLLQREGTAFALERDRVFTYLRVGNA